MLCDQQGIFRRDASIREDDETIIFHLFSECEMSVAIQQQDFELTAELAALRASSHKVGAVVSFVGLVRDFSNDEKIENIYLEHYPGMSEQALNNIISEALVRWQLIAVRVVHRVGLLLPNEQIVLVATAAQHRGAAFAACEFIIDYLKTDAPFWKREQTGKGAQWVETKESDMQRRAHWHQDESAGQSSCDGPLTEMP